MGALYGKRNEASERLIGLMCLTGTRYSNREDIEIGMK